MSSEKNNVFNDEINEKDIEKEALSSDQIDAVAGGFAQERAPARGVDMENRRPAREDSSALLMSDSEFINKKI